MRSNRTIAGAAALAFTTSVHAQGLALDGRINVANAARVAPALWVGRTIRAVAFAGTGDALWVHTSDGVLYASARGGRTVTRGAVVFPDAAPDPAWLAFAAAVPRANPGPLDQHALRVVDPSGVALPAPSSAEPLSAESVMVSRDGGALVAFNSFGPSQVFARGADGAWASRGRPRLPSLRDAAALSRDGRRMAVSTGRTITVVDTATGRPVRTAPAPASWCRWLGERCPDGSLPVDTRWRDVCVRDDGAVVAVGGGRARGSTAGAHRLEVFTVGGAVRAAAELTGSLERARFSPDCARVAVTTLDAQAQSSLQVFDVASGELLGQRILHETGVHLAWSPDGARLAIATERLASLWEPGSGVEALLLPPGALGELTDLTGQARGLDALPEATRGWAQAQVVGPARYAVWLPERYDARYFARSADGRWMAEARGVTVTLRDLARGGAPTRLQAPFVVGHVGLNADGSRLSLVASDRVELRAVPRGAVQRSVPLEDADLRFSWASRGDVFALADRAGGARSVDAATGAVLQRLPPVNAGWPALPLGPDVFARELDAGVLLWNARTGQRATLAAPLRGLRALTTDGSLLCFIAERAAVLRARDGARVAEGPDAFTCALSDDGGRVAWGAREGVTVAPLAGGGATVRITPEGLRVSALALSPDGAVLAAGGGRDLALYDARTGARLMAARAAVDLDALAFSPDGAVLAVMAHGRGGHVLDAAELWGVPAGTEAPAHPLAPARQASRPGDTGPSAWVRRRRGTRARALS
ncbi:MAG: hypothetical protein U0324_29010 [Polyangiales bacterium]